MSAPTLVDVDWLEAHSGDDNIRVVDGTFHMPMWNRNAKTEYDECHIPGAVFFAFPECVDKDAPYGAQMLPPVKKFEEHMTNLGIGLNSHVIIYDNNANLGSFSAPRVWYILRVFGHPKVSILNGGLPKWLAAGKPTTSEVTNVVAPASPYKAEFQQARVKTYEDTLANLKSKSFLLVDARPPGRFNGSAPEPNPAIKPGRIPDSVNVPFTQVLDPETKEIKSVEQLKELFRGKDLDINKDMVAMCGTGLTGCFVVLAAHLCGKDIPLYDGSWMEWFQRADPSNMVDVPE